MSRNGFLFLFVCLLAPSTALAQESSEPFMPPAVTVEREATICRLMRNGSERCDRREPLDANTIAATHLSLLELGYRVNAPVLRDLLISGLTARYVRHADRTVECTIIATTPTGGELAIGQARIHNTDPRQALTWALANVGGAEPPEPWVLTWHPPRPAR